MRGADLRLRMHIDFLAAINGGTERVTLPNGRIVELTIPAGAVEGQTLRLKGQGEPAPQGGEAGDAFVELTIASHPLFARRGDDILLDLPITLSEAVLGAKVKTLTPSGAVMLTVPEHSNPGATLRLKGKGVRRRDGRAGDVRTQERSVAKIGAMTPAGPFQPVGVHRLMSHLHPT